MCSKVIPTLLCLCLAGALSLGACSKKKGEGGRKAPTSGVVGKVVKLQGEVTWSAGKAPKRTPLKVGDPIRAEWTVHTGRDARLTVRLDNGHLWTLAGELDKRVSTVKALTLAPVREGALTQVSDLGSRGGKDRTAAAGLHQEMSVGKSAVATRSDQLDTETAKDQLDEKPRVRAKAFQDEDGRGPAKPAPRKPSPATTTATADSTVRRGEATRNRPTRRARRRNAKHKSAAFKIQVRPRGPSGGKSGGGRVPKALETPPPPPPTTPPAAQPTAPTPSRGRSAARAVIRRYHAKLVRCFTLLDHKGSQVVYIKYNGKTGRIVLVYARGKTSRDPLSRCLASQLRNVKLPPSGSGTRQIAYPVKVR